MKATNWYVTFKVVDSNNKEQFTCGITTSGTLHTMNYATALAYAKQNIVSTKELKEFDTPDYKIIILGWSPNDLDENNESNSFWNKYGNVIVFSVSCFISYLFGGIMFAFWN